MSSPDGSLSTVIRREDRGVLLRDLLVSERGFGGELPGRLWVCFAFFNRDPCTDMQAPMGSKKVIFFFP